MASNVSATTSSSDTIASFLLAHGKPLEEVNEEYHAQLMMGRSLLGIVPNCHSIFQIFPPAFTSYNLLVPSFLNIPWALLGLSVPMRQASLAAFVASSTARCRYCTAHSCTLALRRGADPDLLLSRRKLTSTEAAIVDVAKALSFTPSSFSAKQKLNLEKSFSQHDAEWIMLTIAMMGFLNVFMDATGVQLEQTCVEESKHVLKQSGWTSGKHGVAPPVNWMQAPESDTPKRASLWTDLANLCYAPALAMYERSVLQGIPTKWPQVGEHLASLTGYDFPVLKYFLHSRPLRAFTGILREHLVGTQVQIPPQMKFFMSLIHGTVNENNAAKKDFRSALHASGCEGSDIEAVEHFAHEDTNFEKTLDLAALRKKMPNLQDEHLLMLYVAKACATLPTNTTPQVVQLVCDHLSPAQTVELISWMGVCMALHRIYAFYLPHE